MGVHGNGNTGKGRGGSKSNSEFKAQGFVPYDKMQFLGIELSTEEKAEFKSLLAAGELDDLDIDPYILAGYEYTLKRDSKGGGIVASLRCPLYELDNAGWIVTGRGSDTATAHAVLAYKICHLIGDRFWKQAMDERRGGADFIA